jgi:hypothetical protein
MLRTMVPALFLACFSAPASEIGVLSPVPHWKIEAPLHWHFYGGHCGSAMKKQVRSAMKAAGHVEDPSGFVGVGKFSGGLRGETLFLLYPQIQGAVFVATMFDGTVIDASLIMRRGTQQKFVYSLTTQLQQALLKGMPP